MNDEVLYLEADEEITAAIDKLLKLKSKSVRVVVPKRSTLLQSVVNLKLLKKAAADAGKELVLVTGDRTATHLASRVGLAVAATLKGQAVKADSAPPLEETSGDIVEGQDEGEPAPPPISEAAGSSTAASVKAAKPSYASPMMVRKPVDNAPGAGPTAAGAAADVAAGSKIRIPDFNALQKRLLWVGGAIGLVILLLVINYFIKTAHITLYAKSSKVDVNFDFTVDPTAHDSDPSKAILAAQNMSQSKDLTSTVPASGKKDVGTKAGGQIVVSNCYDNQPHTLVAGTRFQSPDNKIFRSTADATVPGGTGSFFGCTTPGKVTVPVQSDQSGDQYNLAAGTKYSIPGLGAEQSGINGVGNQMSGGTSKQVAVVTQSDIDKAKADMLAKDKDAGQKDLENKTASGYRAITESFAQTAGEAKANPGPDAEATQTTITLNVNYTELAVNKGDFDELLKVQEQKQIGDQNQIYENGATAAKMVPGKKDAGGKQDFNLSTEAFGGAKLDKTAIAKEIQGMRYGDAAEHTAKLPGVERSELSLWPFWVTKLPHITSHIKIDIKVSSNKS